MAGLAEETFERKKTFRKARKKARKEGKGLWRCQKAPEVILGKKGENQKSKEPHNAGQANSRVKKAHSEEKGERKSNKWERYHRKKEDEIKDLLRHGRLREAFKSAERVRGKLEDTSISNRGRKLYNLARNRIEKNYRKLTEKAKRKLETGAYRRALSILQKRRNDFESLQPWGQKIDDLIDRVKNQRKIAKADEGSCCGDGTKRDEEDRTRDRGHTEETRTSSSSSQRVSRDITREERKEKYKGYPIPYPGLTDRQKGVINRGARYLLKAKRLIDKGKTKKAIEYVREVRQTLGTPRVPAVEALAARVLRAHEKYEQAHQMVWPYARTWNEDQFNTKLKRCYLMAGLLKRKVAQPYESLKMLDWLTGKAEPGLFRVRSAEGVGQALVEVTRYTDAIKSYRFALKSLDQLWELSKRDDDEKKEKKEKIGNESSKTQVIDTGRDEDVIDRIEGKSKKGELTKKIYRRYRNRIRKRLQKAKRLRAIQKFGKDFVLFVTGQRSVVMCETGTIQRIQLKA